MVARCFLSAFEKCGDWLQLLKESTSKMHLGSLRIYATDYNLLTFDKLKVIDPEARTGASTMYPVVKVMNLGLKLGF